MGNPEDPTKPGEVPDLDLGPLVQHRQGPARPAAPAPKAKPAASAGALDYFGTGFDSDHFDAGGSIPDVGGSQRAESGAYDGGSMDLNDDEEQANLNLELSSYRPPAPVGSVAPAAHGQSAAPGAPAMSSAPAARPTSLAPPLPSVEQAAVSLLARYGPAPSAIYLTPLYAFRVFARKRELRADLTRLNAETKAQETKLDELFAGLASAMRPSLEGDSRFEASFAPVRQLESIAGERGAALSQTNEQFRGHNDQLEQQLRAVQEQIPPLDAEKARASTEVTEREAALGRVAAKQKRFLIEARSVKMSALPPGAPPNAALPSEASERIQVLETQAAAVQPEVDQHKHELAQAQAALQAIRNQIGALGQHTRRIQDQQKGLARQFQGQLSAASAGYSDAQRELTQALAGVGRALCAQKESLAMDPATLSTIRSAELNLARLAESNALHLGALDAFDREAVKRGYLVVTGAVGLVILLIVLVMVL